MKNIVLRYRQLFKNEFWAWGTFVAIMEVIIQGLLFFSFSSVKCFHFVAWLIWLVVCVVIGVEEKRKKIILQSIRKIYIKMFCEQEKKQ